MKNIWKRRIVYCAGLIAAASIGYYAGTKADYRDCPKYSSVKQDYVEHKTEKRDTDIMKMIKKYVWN